MIKTEDPRQLTLDEWIKNANSIKVLHLPSDDLDKLLGADDVSPEPVKV